MFRCIRIKLLAFLILITSPVLVCALGQRQVLSLDHDQWLIATDPNNVGKSQSWWRQPQPEAKATRVPWITQDPFPRYHGLVWYWRNFEVPVNPHEKGRYRLRFWAVMYKADVYLNDVYIGSHENGETPFVFDVTDVVRANQTNRLAVRVLDPREDQRIDGILRKETPRRTSEVQKQHSGIEDSVELLLVPALCWTDVYVVPELNTGEIKIDAEVHNGTEEVLNGQVIFEVTLDGDAKILDRAEVNQNAPPGQTHVKCRLQVTNPLLWDLDNPTLYRVTAQVKTSKYASSVDTDSRRFGFREFKYERGYFRLNGRRIYLRCAHTANHSPIGLWVPDDVGANPDLLQRRMLQAKQMGFNMIRFLGGIPRRNTVELCDEIGLMLYVETLASWQLEDSPYLKERYDRALRESILRDRNHPSITIWGLLNETGANAPVYRYAKTLLPLVRSYDSTRLVFLNSGRFDKEADVGSASNPGSIHWDVYLGGEGPAAGNSAGDVHSYPAVPHSARAISQLRTLGQGLGEHVFLSEYGIGSGQHVPGIMKHFEQQGKTHMLIYQIFSGMHQSFLSDWQRWRMGELYGKPGDFFDESLAVMAARRLGGLNAVRANPYLAGHSLTSFADIPNSGEGVVTCGGEIKPGALVAMRDAWAPLRFCLFTEPYHVYRGDSIHLEAVLANEDVLRPGGYEIHLSVLNAKGEKTWDTTVPIQILGGEPLFAQSFFNQNIVANWPTDRYRFTAAFVNGGVGAQGRETQFYVTDNAEMSPLSAPVVVWGEDKRVTDWLSREGISYRPFDPGNATQRELILVGTAPPKGDPASQFKELCRHIGRGSAAVFLDPKVFNGSGGETAWAPLTSKGKIGKEGNWVYLSDQWIKDHPLFSRMPNKGLMDFVYYRNLIVNAYWSDADVPVEAVAGNIYTAWTSYKSGFLTAVYELGAGRFILNTLNICSHLGKDPGAELLLRNMLNCAGREVSKTIVPLPPDYENVLDRLYKSSPSLQAPPP